MKLVGSEENNGCSFSGLSFLKRQLTGLIGSHGIESENPTLPVLPTAAARIQRSWCRVHLGGVSNRRMSYDWTSW